MNKTQKITLKLLGRSYDISINPEEEEHIRAAAKLINETISSYKNRYYGWNEIDLMAMISVRYVAELLNLKADNEADMLERELQILDSRLKGYLEQDKVDQNQI